MARKGITRRHSHFTDEKASAHKRKIIESTITLLANEGPGDLSAFSVAKRAGLRRSNVVYYFPTKKDLVAAAVAEVINKGQEFVLQAVADKRTSAECLDAYIEALFQWLETYPEHASVMGILHYYGALGGELRELNDKVREVGEARIADILHLGKPGSPSQRERTIARLIREMLIGNMTNLISSHGSESADLRQGCELVKCATRSLVNNFDGKPAPICH